MKQFTIVVCAAFLVVVAIGAPALHERIKHIVVLMEENRSFDHYMGWSPLTKHGINASYCNLVNATDPSSRRVCMNPTAPYVNFCDPDHSFPATTYKIFGPTAYGNGNLTDPTMSGFVEFERDVQHHLNPTLQYCGVMDGFSPERLPVFTALAEEFAFFDMFFASMPGPTWPNRLFFLAGTSAGLTETIPWYHLEVGKLFPVRTFFDQVRDAGGEYRYVYDDTPWELFIEGLAHAPEFTIQMEQFYADVREGRLPNFVFINPRSGVNLTTGYGSNDLHPDHDVALGEKLYKDLYEALRASPQWNETLFAVLFEEHGGFWDHVAPPAPIPPPGDGEASYPDKFDFARAGIRIPALLVSPWIPRGTVLTHPPEAQKPAPNSIYELTSFMATARKLLGFMNGTKPLTQRDAWAATFEHVFAELDTPRDDCPTQLPAAPPPSATAAAKEPFRPVNGLQTAIMGVNAHLAGVPHPRHITTQGEVGAWVQEHHTRHREHTLRWKASKRAGAAPFELRLQAQQEQAFATRIFFVATNATARPGVQTISATVDNATWCWDSQNGTVVTVSLCQPSRDVIYNRDPFQQWAVLSDASVRPAHNSTLCVTSRYAQNTSDTQLYLRQCGGAGSDDQVGQRFAWMWDAPEPSGGAANFQWGDDFLEIRMVNATV